MIISSSVFFSRHFRCIGRHSDVWEKSMLFCVDVDIKRNAYEFVVMNVRERKKERDPKNRQNAQTGTLEANETRPKCKYATHTHILNIQQQQLFASSSCYIFFSPSSSFSLFCVFVYVFAVCAMF